MKFEFDTANDGPNEAAALTTALTVLYGQAVVSAINGAADVLEADPRAVDGHPVTAAPTGTAPHTARVPAVGEQAILVDAAGLPWDERIHASTRTTNKDGTWSRRRNTPDATFDTVMAELIAARNGAPVEASAADPTPLAAPAAPGTVGSSTEAATVGQTAQTGASPSSPNEPAAAAATVVPPPPPTSTQAASPTSGNVTFPQLMVKITKAQTAGKIDPAKVTEFLAMFGLTAVKELASAGADTVQAVNAMVDEHVGA